VLSSIAQDSGLQAQECWHTITHSCRYAILHLQNTTCVSPACCWCACLGTCMRVQNRSIHTYRIGSPKQGCLHAARAAGLLHVCLNETHICICTPRQISLPEQGCPHATRAARLLLLLLLLLVLEGAWLVWVLLGGLIAASRGQSTVKEGKKEEF